MLSGIAATLYDSLIMSREPDQFHRPRMTMTAPPSRWWYCELPGDSPDHGLVTPLVRTRYACICQRRTKT